MLDSTQWKIIDEGYAKLKPLLLAMEAVAAKASLFSDDDTRLKFLSILKHNKANPNKKTHSSVYDSDYSWEKKLKSNFILFRH